MPTIQHSVSIDRPIGEVFAFISDGGNASVYDASVTRADQLGNGDTKVGTRWEGATNILGRDFGWITECVDLVPDRSMTVRTITGRIPFEIRFEVTEEEGHTRLDYTLVAERGLGGVFGRIADPIVMRTQARTVRANLVTVKELLETGLA